MIMTITLKAFGSPEKNAEDLRRLSEAILDADGTLPASGKAPSLNDYTAHDELLAKLQNQIRGELNPDQMKIRQWTNLLTVSERQFSFSKIAIPIHIEVDTLQWCAESYKFEQVS